MEQPRWAPRWAESALAAVTGVVLCGLGLVVDDAGRFLGVVGGVGLLVLAGSDLLLRPRLAADREGVAIRTPLRRIRLPWDRVDAIRVDERQRYGMRLRTLEIDSGDQLYLLGRRSLGADPVDVAESLAALQAK